MITVFTKDPDSVLDYPVNWGPWLDKCYGGDTLDSVDWILDSGITLGVMSYGPWNSATVAYCWILGGTLGEIYNVTCRITTVGGRIDDYSFQLSIEST